MEQIHAFIKGISADIDPSKRDSLSWDFPTEGIRVLNHEGQGMMIVPLPGNSKTLGDKTATIPLTKGYTVIGACTFAQIIYITLVNTITGITEIGSYPSYNDVLQRLNKVYSPFKNRLAGSEELNSSGGGARLPFQTTLLGYGINTEIDMFAAPSYDNSVNLYLCDNQNPNLCINSGFSPNGYNRQTYNDLSFPYGVRLVKSTVTTITPVFNGLFNDGTLSPGNFFLFFRYVTASFDRTSFMSELGPISVSIGNTARDTEGVVDETSGISNKSMSITLSNLDRDYDYIEIGVMRYHGPGISVAIREIYLINRYYKITGNTCNIIIYGDEGQEVLTISDILNYSNIPLICKSHTTAANRYIGTNWKDIEYDREALSEFASRIYPDVVFQKMPDMSIVDYENNPTTIPQYKDSNNILSFRSLMRGEIYPHAIEFEFSNGRRSEAYPMMSCRYTYELESDGQGGAVTVLKANPIDDKKGLIEMPDYSQTVNLVLTKENDLTYIMGLSFVMADANAYFTEQSDKFSNVIGYRILCGERKANVLYQGIALRCFNKLDASNIFFGEDIVNSSVVASITEAESLFMPLPNYSSGFRQRLPATTVQSAYTDNNRFFSVASTKFRYAIYSPDYILSNIHLLRDNVKYYVKYIANLSTFIPFLNETISFSLEINELTKAHVSYSPKAGVLCSVKNTLGNTYKEGDQWSSKLNDYNVDEFHKEFGVLLDFSPSISNRSINSQRYIGFEPDITTQDYDNTIVAITNFATKEAYWNHIQDTFILSDESYNSITNILPIKSADLIANVFGGDCFLSRTIFRSHHWGTLPEGNRADVWYPHGYVMSFISENRVNTQMRSEINAGDMTYTYFPKSLSNSLFSSLMKWAVTAISDDVRVEACYVNPGYNRIYNENTFRGFNNTIPFTAIEYPNRVWLSNPQIPGSFVNSYRQFGIMAYKDFPWEDGPINCIKELFGKLITICDRAINEHFYNESQYRVPTNQGELLLGTTDVLAQQCRKLSNYGSTHTHGIGVAESSVVGIDTDKDIIWRVIPGEGGLKAENMSETYQVQSWCREKFAELKAAGGISDIPSWGNGVVIGYDPYFKEIHFTLLTPSTITGSLTITKNRTITNGVLYNWYAVTDVRGIAPPNWHVLNYTDDYMNLYAYNGNSEVLLLGKLMDSNLNAWLTITGHSDVYNFRAVGSGSRNETGLYQQLGVNGFMWIYYDTDANPSQIDFTHNLLNGSISSGINAKQGNCIRYVNNATTLLDGEYGSVTGNDGTVYRTKCIGSKEYTIENTIETKFRNGDLIPTVTDNTTWANPDTDVEIVIAEDVVSSLVPSFIEYGQFIAQSFSLTESRTINAIHLQKPLVTGAPNFKLRCEIWDEGTTDFFGVRKGYSTNTVFANESGNPFVFLFNNIVLAPGKYWMLFRYENTVLHNDANQIKYHVSTVNNYVSGAILYGLGGAIWTIHPTEDLCCSVVYHLLSSGASAALCYFNNDIKNAYIDYPDTVIDTTEIILGKRYTLTFNEGINAFLGTAPFAAERYYNNGKDFFSSPQSVLGSDGLYQHNNKSTSMVFYGAQKDMLISVIVNGLSEQGNTSQLRKIFKAGSVISGSNAFHSLDINTPNQHGSLSPFLNTVQFWKSAEYTNHIWEYPMPLQDSTDKDQFQIDTDMRGLWAKITLTYRNVATTFIQSIRTLFNVTSI